MAKKIITHKDNVQDEAVRFVLDNKQDLIQKFILDKKPFQIDLITIFMAGSPGAGKTEFSLRYLPTLPTEISEANHRKLKAINKSLDYEPKALFVRLDGDEIRSFLPQYEKADNSLGRPGNSHLVQKAVNIGIETLRDYCLENKISFLLDGTFGNNYSTMRKIIHTSLSLGRVVTVIYLYMDPIAAWEFTKAREYLEGRNILPSKFVEQFFRAQTNIERAKQEFKDRISLYYVLKDQNNKVRDVKLNIDSLEEELSLAQRANLIKPYNKDGLLNLISEL